MRGYFLKVLLLVVVFMLVIMKIDLCLCSAAVCTSCYVHMEGQCSVKIQTPMFGVCVCGVCVCVWCVRAGDCVCGVWCLCIVCVVFV
jgi:hypothetical protein